VWYLGIDGKIILEWILENSDRKVWTGCIWFRIETSEGSYEHGSKPSGFAKDGEFLDDLSDY
jgi:hypothetical protein